MKKIILILFSLFFIFCIDTFSQSGTQRTKSEIMTLFADNVAGGISAQDLRDFVESVYFKYTITKTTATDYTVGTTEAGEKYGGVIYVTGNATITLPAVGDGMNFTIITVGNYTVSADPNSSDKMYLDGVLLDDGDKATNLTATGDMIVFTYYSADGWYASSNSWTDGG